MLFWNKSVLCLALIELELSTKTPLLPRVWIHLWVFKTPNIRNSWTLDHFGLDQHVLWSKAKAWPRPSPSSVWKVISTWSCVLRSCALGWNEKRPEIGHLQGRWTCWCDLKKMFLQVLFWFWGNQVDHFLFLKNGLTCFVDRFCWMISLFLLGAAERSWNGHRNQVETTRHDIIDMMPEGVRANKVRTKPFEMSDFGRQTQIEGIALGLGANKDPTTQKRDHSNAKTLAVFNGTRGFGTVVLQKHGFFTTHESTGFFYNKMDENGKTYAKK